MSDADKRIHCRIHGETPATFVCEHLRDGVACGFHGAEEDDPWPDAWCDQCEAAFQSVGEWTDETSPRISALCTGCYETVRARNRRVPEPLAPGQLVVTEADYLALVHACCERAKVRQDATDGAWHFADRERWDFDDERRTLRFSGSGDPGVVADALPVGSFSTKTGTWLWSWANSGYPDTERARVGQVRVFGEVRGMKRLREPHWACEEIEGWEVSQIAADLLGAQAIYRAPFDHVHVFFLLTGFRDARTS